MTVTIDPRRHDAVLFGLDEAAATAPAARATRALAGRLDGAGVRTATFSPDLDGAGPLEVAGRLGVRPGRSVVVTGTDTVVTAARGGGFALVIGVGPAADHPEGADVVVTDPAEIAVRTGDLRMSALPSAMTAIDLIAAGRPAVFFDFDGTLSDIVNDPGAARLTEGAAETLRSLTSCCPVAVLSGRDLADVRQRIGLPGIWYAGSHGFELTGPDGGHHQNDTAAGAVPVLAEAAAGLTAQLAAIDGVVVEHKRYAVATHYRNAARESVGDVTAAVRAAGRHYALRVTTGREVIELRPEIDWDKGATLRWIIDRLDAAPGSLLPIYLGDDITDEDAFDAVNHPDLAGIGIVVRHTEDGDRATAARYALDSPTQVSEFVGKLADRIAAGQN